MSHRETFEEDYEFEVEKNESGGYSVNLPHQCDSWEIIGADVGIGHEESEIHDGGYPACPKSKELAVRQMELFVKRATEAVEKLKKL